MGKMKQLVCVMCGDEKDPGQDFCCWDCERDYHEQSFINHVMEQQTEEAPF